MATNFPPVDQLEEQAGRERERLRQRVAALRGDVARQFDVQRIAEAQIRTRPGASYGAAAVLAGLAGYVFGRLMKL